MIVIGRGITRLNLEDRQKFGEMATPQLELLDASQPVGFVAPTKQIRDAAGLAHWQTSLAYTDLVTFLLQLNLSMFPTSDSPPPVEASAPFSAPIEGLRVLIDELTKLIQNAPPETGPRRYGNAAFRKWYSLSESALPELLEKHVSGLVNVPSSSQVSALDEVKAYLLGSFGSEQRLDYGTGHELSFLAFLACLCKLSLLPLTSPSSIVLDVIDPYLTLIRTLIKTYTLEPAGSHGVWGLDDHAFLPYIFGSAQLSSKLPASHVPPIEGSAPWAPAPGSVAKKDEVARWADRNMYFAAISFIHAVKSGPFWEHSPILYDISGVQAGWAKINKGMLKMYAVEVMGKFPVVQHFPFGGILKWDTDPRAEEMGKTTTAHAAAVAEREKNQTPPQPQGMMPPPTGAPWASKSQGGSSTMPATSAPWARRPEGGMPMTGAPWARPNDKR